MSISRASVASGILALVQLLERGERFAIGQRLVVAVLGFDLGGKVLVLAGRVGVPPGEVHRDFERPDLDLVLADELPGGGGRIGRFGQVLGGAKGGSHGERRGKRKRQAGAAKRDFHVGSSRQLGCECETLDGKAYLTDSAAERKPVGRGAGICRCCWRQPTAGAQKKAPRDETSGSSIAGRTGLSMFRQLSCSTLPYQRYQPRRTMRPL